MLCTTTTWATDYNVGTDAELRTAIQNDGANIIVTADIDLSNITLSIESGRTVTIDLGGYTLNRRLTLRGENGGQVITVRNGATLNLSNGTLTGGYGGDGGGLLNEGGTVTLTNVNITGNTADDRGGGISNHGTLTMTGGSITGNTSRDGIDLKGGGGIFNYSGATATLTNVSITGNEAKEKGGGGLCNYGTITLNDCIISGNRAQLNGGGIWEMPYRPTPLYFKVDGKEYFNERPVSTQQAGFVYVSQMRSWLPRQVGGCFWFANDDGNMVPFTPVYCCATESPRPYNTPGADDVTFSMDNAFWVQNWVSNMVYPRYSMLFPSLKQVRDSLDNSYFRAQKEVEDRALLLDEAARVKFLTDYTAEKADQMLARWRQLATYLIVKYNDMAVKPDENGRFLRSKYGLGATVKRPGYSDKFARELIKQTGSKFEKR